MRSNIRFGTLARGIAAAVGACLMGVAWVGACAQDVDGGLNPRPLVPPATRQTSQAGSAASLPVAVSVTTDKRVYKPAEPIKITFAVKNTGKQAASLRFSNTQHYDFTITPVGKASARPVWQWSQHRLFGMMVSAQPLNAGESKLYTDVFAPAAPGTPANAAADKPAPLAPGKYTLTATLTTMGNAPRPRATTQFLVK